MPAPSPFVLAILFSILAHAMPTPAQAMDFEVGTRVTEGFYYEKVIEFPIIAKRYEELAKNTCERHLSKISGDVIRKYSGHWYEDNRCRVVSDEESQKIRGTFGYFSKDRLPELVTTLQFAETKARHLLATNSYPGGHPNSPICGHLKIPQAAA